MQHRFKLLLLCFLALAGRFSGAAQTPDFRVTDPDATKRTQALFTNLHLLSGKRILFGHQDDLAYGVGWKRVKDSSDVKAACGDYPAVYGWELGHLENDGSVQNLDSVRFDDMQRWIREGYQRGGIITVSWHMNNPKTRGSAWDTVGGGARLWLPGGAQHAEYDRILDKFAEFVHPLKSGGFLFKKQIPIIFRPFHEMTGGWFWWGHGHTPAADYIALWQYTVHYLRDVKKLHNLLFAWTPAEHFETKQEFLEFYPGDNWVDLMGIDNYGDMQPDPDSRMHFQKHMKTLVQEADRRGKIAVLSETGAEGIKNEGWWTNVLLQNLLSDPDTRRIVYALVWRNANKKHHYAPFPGHPSHPDFKKLYADPVMVFEKGLPDMYKMPKHFK
jgi:mannan endo-1,4-beta-mannosidase